MAPRTAAQSHQRFRVQRIPVRVGFGLVLGPRLAVFFRRVDLFQNLMRGDMAVPDSGKKIIQVLVTQIAEGALDHLVAGIFTHAFKEGAHHLPPQQNELVILRLADGPPDC